VLHLSEVWRAWVLNLGLLMHPSCLSQVSTVHLLVSLQTIGVLIQFPVAASQESIVHLLSSLQVLPTFLQVPVAESQLSTVQGL